MKLQEIILEIKLKNPIDAPITLTKIDEIKFINKVTPNMVYKLYNKVYELLGNIENNYEEYSNKMKQLHGYFVKITGKSPFEESFDWMKLNQNQLNLLYKKISEIEKKLNLNEIKLTSGPTPQIIMNLIKEKYKTLSDSPNINGSFRKVWDILRNNGYNTKSGIIIEDWIFNSASQKQLNNIAKELKTLNEIKPVNKITPEVINQLEQKYNELLKNNMGGLDNINVDNWRRAFQHQGLFRKYFWKLDVENEHINEKKAKLSDLTPYMSQEQLNDVYNRLNKIIKGTTDHEAWGDIDEIKIIGKVIPELVQELWLDIISKSKNGYPRGLDILFDKYDNHKFRKIQKDGETFFDYLYKQDRLNSFYKELKQIP